MSQRPSRSPRVIGLTGGIASGKSTVARFLRELGAPVVDADALARRVVEPGSPALAEIAARWPEVIGPDGRLDRKRLGEIVFGDPEARRELERITHPRISALSRKEIEAHGAAGAPAVVYEAALIVENRLHEGMDGLIVVSVPESVQLERLRDRDGLKEEEARSRLAAQLPLEAKRRAASFVIDNAGTPEETRTRTRQVWEQILREASEA